MTAAAAVLAAACIGCGRCNQDAQNKRKPAAERTRKMTFQPRHYARSKAVCIRSHLAERGRVMQMSILGTPSRLVQFQTQFNRNPVTWAVLARGGGRGPCWRCDPGLSHPERGRARDPVQEFADLLVLQLSIEEPPPHGFRRLRPGDRALPLDGRPMCD